MPIYLPIYKSFDQKSRLLGKFRECLKNAKKVVAIYVIFSFISMLNKLINPTIIEYEHIAAFDSTSHIAIKSKKNELKNRVRAGDVMIFDQHKKSETGDDVLLSNKSDNEIIGTIGWMHDNSIAIDINDERMIIDNNDGDVKILVLVAIIPHAGIRRTNVD